MKGLRAVMNGSLERNSTKLASFCTPFVTSFSVLSAVGEGGSGGEGGTTWALGYVWASLVPRPEPFSVTRKPSRGLGSNLKLCGRSHE